MKNIRTIRTLLILIGLTWLMTDTGISQVPQWRTDRQLRNTVNRAVNRTNALKRTVQRNRYPWDNNNTDERIADMVTTFSNELTGYRSSLMARRDAEDEFERVLNRATRINIFLDRQEVTSSVRNRWRSIRTDINSLARINNVAWNWNDTGPAGSTRTLTGTYRLNTSMSDNVATVIDRSLGYYGSAQRDAVRRRLERRLQSPEMIAIDRNARTITMASSLQAPITFDADGISRSETNPRGRTTRTVVTSTGAGFTVNTTGDRTNDYNVAFNVEPNGRLRVTRRIYLENRNDQVTVTSVYDRLNDRADWVAVNSRYDGQYGITPTGSFYIPNNVILTATLRRDLDTRDADVGDTFVMDVVSPSQYRGAVIDGKVTDADRSGRITGRAELQLDFDTITINGRRHNFAGLIESVRTTNGDNVTVNNEGTIRDRSQTTQTVKRAGIGALLGAVIGAIAGGGEGAAIGAGVGAGAGAGTVLIGGRDSIEIDSGSTFTIRSGSPSGTYSKN